MNPDKISSLCSMLDSIWTEQPGQEVLYQWADWLQNSLVSHLGFDNEILLGPYGVRRSRDKRAVSGSRSPDADIPYIRGYDVEKRCESFRKSLHECCICYSESAGFDFVKLPCQHFFCTKCMETYTDIHVSEGTVNKLQCPDTKCGETVPPGILKRLLGDEAYERWETLMLQKALDTIKDVVYCPRYETPCIDDEENLALCFKCYYSFCTICKEKRHVGVACMTPELRHQILKERQEDTARLGEEQRRKENDMINLLISEKGSYELFPPEWNPVFNEQRAIGQARAALYADGQFQLIGQFCPICRQFNAKVGNNNHLFCWACQARFCYLCKKVVKKCSQHYGPKGCKQHTDG